MIGGTNEHNGTHNHFGINDVVQNIIQISNDWKEEHPDKHILEINDISLPLGGKFDVNGKWHGAHQTHREGKDIDIRTELSYYNGIGQIIYRDGGVPIRIPRTETFNLNNGQLNTKSILIGNKKFEKICRRYSSSPHIHRKNSAFEHYHIDFDSNK